MRKDRKNGFNERSIKKERMIMIGSCALVLTALTMTGVYMKNQESKPDTDGYTIDFSAMEKQAERERLQEPSVTSDDLDYLPMEEGFLSEAGSKDITIPGLTGEKAKNQNTKKETGKATGKDLTKSGKADAYESSSEESVQGNAGSVAEGENQESSQENSDSNSPIITQLHFSNQIFFPVNGEVLIPYSMDSSVYFQTLDQYKYNPAVIIAASEGTAVTACAGGQILDIKDDPQLGHMLVMDLGDGYEVTYGQVKDITYGVGSYVDAGTTIASVAAPTKYFCVEGANLYFQMKKDGVPIDPMQYFGQ